MFQHREEGHWKFNTHTFDGAVWLLWTETGFRVISVPVAEPVLEAAALELQKGKQFYYKINPLLLEMQHIDWLWLFMAMRHISSVFKRSFALETSESFPFTKPRLHEHHCFFPSSALRVKMSKTERSKSLNLTKKCSESGWTPPLNLCNSWPTITRAQSQSHLGSNIFWLVTNIWLTRQRDYAHCICVL